MKRARTGKADTTKRGRRAGFSLPTLGVSTTLRQLQKTEALLAELRRLGVLRSDGHYSLVGPHDTRVGPIGNSPISRVAVQTQTDWRR